MKKKLSPKTPVDHAAAIIAGFRQLEDMRACGPASVQNEAGRLLRVLEKEHGIKREAVR